MAFQSDNLRDHSFHCFLTQVTALHLAAWFSSGSVVRALIEAGANVNARDSSEQTALHLAAWHNPVTVPVLLEANAEVNLLNSQECSPLYHAARRSHREAVIALCAAGANPYHGYNPLTDSYVCDEVKVLIRDSGWAMFSFLNDAMF